MDRFVSRRHGNPLAAALRALRGRFALVGLLSLLANLLLLTPTIYMLQVYDRVLVSRSELTLLAVSVVALVLFAVLALAERMRTRVLVDISVAIDRMLGARVFAASVRAGLDPSLRTLPRGLADLAQLRQFLTGSGAFAFFDAPWVPVYVGVLLLLHPALGAMALLFATLQCLVAWHGHRRTAPLARASGEAAGAEAAFLRAKFQNAEALESMGMLGHLRQRWRGRQQAQLARSADLQALTQRITALSKFLRYSQQSLALGLGALLVIDGQLSVGAMMAANLLMTRALAPIDMLVGSWRAWAGARAAWGRLQALLAAAPERGAVPRDALPRDALLGDALPGDALPGDALPVGAVPGDAAPRGLAQRHGPLELRAVSVAVPGRTAPLLDGIDLTLRPGTVTAVVGPSGSGKSTLARVVAGAWPGFGGEALFGGMPLEDSSRGEPAVPVGFLPQEVELFEGSIAENIARLGRVESSQVIAAARGVGLHETILRMPRGYDTPVGEAGSALSGGQRQRIGLARAIYGRPGLVVLDEPNANLDEAGEAALEALLRALQAQGAIVLVVTHRPAVLRVADRLVLLRDGRIERDGACDEVLAQVRRAAGASPQPAPAPAPASAAAAAAAATSATPATTAQAA